MAQKNWYLLSTKTGAEKKVSEILTNKRIHNYVPYNRVRKQGIDKKRVSLSPIFPSYVFVQIASEDLEMFRKIDHVKGLVYWLGTPVVLRDREIELIRDFVNENSLVKFEKTRVDMNDMVRITTGPVVDRFGNVNNLNNSVVKMTIPSLGCTLAAEVEVNRAAVVDNDTYAFDASKVYEVVNK